MNENEEIFVDIENYEGLYQVSNWGNVKSLIDNHGNPREKILKPGKDTNGYLTVILSKNGNIKNCKIHRLVAQAFIENPNNLPMVNHKNEIKTDNRAVNLEPCTQKYNVNYKNAQARRVDNTDYKAIGIKNAEKLSKQVYQYDLNGNLIKIWKSTAECGKNGYSSGNISACCRNCFNREGNNVYKGYIWSYEELK